MTTEFDVFISGEAVDLVVLTEQLAAQSNWYAWFNDASVTNMMQHHYFPNTPALQVQFFKENIEGNRSTLQMGVVHKMDRVFIGVISLSAINFQHRKCEIGGLIGETRYQSLVYYVEAFRLMLDHGFEQLNMRRIYGGTLIKELADLLIRVFGFSLEGVKRQDVFKNGAYMDVYLLGLIKDEYKPVSRKTNNQEKGTDLV
ncbi:MAG: N-acetyltransferase [Desulfovibrionaceae bacterium]|nr:MAG: N-acetyltransferase [Desulfovibrionaceae bacterium]